MAQYWFRQKKFGYGATPNTWQGWALTIASVLAVVGVILSAPMIGDGVWRGLWVGAGLAITVIATVTIAYRKTEGGWRWRNGRD